MNAQDETPLIVAQPGDDEHTQIAAMVEYLRASAALITPSYDDPLKAQSHLMTAAATLSGVIFGTLIVAGLAKEQDKKRAADVAAKNFSSGIDVGKRAAMRIAMQDVGGNA